MAIILDLINDSEVQDTLASKRYVRICRAKGLDTSVPAAVLDKALDEAGVAFGTGHPSNATAVLIERTARGDNDGGGGLVRLVYEQNKNPSLTMGGSIFTISDDTTLASELAYIDSNGNVLETFPNGGSYTQGTGRPAPQQKYRPLRTLAYNWVTDARLSKAARKTVGKVNSASWNGEAIGYWLCWRVASVSPDAGRSFNHTAVFLSQVEHDWKHFQLHFNLGDGKVSDYAGINLATQRNQAYAVGKFTASSNYGLLIAGLYPTENFASVFSELTEPDA